MSTTGKKHHQSTEFNWFGSVRFPSAEPAAFIPLPFGTFGQNVRSNFNLMRQWRTRTYENIANVTGRSSATEHRPFPYGRLDFAKAEVGGNGPFRTTVLRCVILPRSAFDFDCLICFDFNGLFAGQSLCSLLRNQWGDFITTSIFDFTIYYLLIYYWIIIISKSTRGLCGQIVQMIPNELNLTFEMFQVLMVWCGRSLSHVVSTVIDY